MLKLIIASNKHRSMRCQTLPLPMLGAYRDSVNKDLEQNHPEHQRLPQMCWKSTKKEQLKTPFLLK